ncbi:MAG: phospholipase [Muribaculaceae bacterium]|nr:phospholipase [Muribaculaceae bacterium]MBR1551480.1 phospholipase [Muribaculaceae bacterium]
MKPALMILGLLMVVGLVLWLLDRRARNRGDVAPLVEPPQGCTDDCCSTHATCPSTQLLAAECGPLAYFDDEELDDYRGREAQDYTDDEVEQWRDVLMTLRATDLLPWRQSVKRRGLVMPQAIADEFLLRVAEAQ